MLYIDMFCAIPNFYIFCYYYTYFIIAKQLKVSIISNYISFINSSIYTISFTTYPRMTYLISVVHIEIVFCFLLHKEIIPLLMKK